MRKKASYARSVINGRLSHTALDSLREFIKKRRLTLKEVTETQLKQHKVTKSIGKLELYTCCGRRSWEGLIVGFPGTRKDLLTKKVGTPYLRLILYPILDLHGKLRKQTNRPMPCLYLLGERFDDVFLRKFNFLKSLIPHVIVFTDDLRKCALRAYKPPTEKATSMNEYYVQKSLCEQMASKNGLTIPIGGNESIEAKFISYEVPTVAGTKDPERLDILGYDMNDNSLIAFELKGPRPGRIELENLFLQGLEHRDWLEENKMAVKLAFDSLNGKKINTRKRVKLVLGICDNAVPSLFADLKDQAIRKDPPLKIEFCRLLPPKNYGDKVKLSHFHNSAICE